MPHNSTDIGSVPWQRDDMIAALPEFEALYAQRPIVHNEGGMRAPHAFLAWFFLRQLEPSLIVESGVWRGQGTWLIEQACPGADILCLDPSLSVLVHKSKRAEYSNLDFSLIDLGDVDPAKTVCLFDDHQNALMRLQQMRWKGLRWATFDDNYPPGAGDCYSLKQALAGAGFEPPRPAEPEGDFRSMVRTTADRLRQQVPKTKTHERELRRQLRTYYEGPPLVTPTRREHAPSGLDYKPALLDANSQSPLVAEPEPYVFMCLAELLQSP